MFGRIHFNMCSLFFLILFWNNIWTILGSNDENCYLDGYHQCDGYKKCCTSAEVCVGKDACLAIRYIKWCTSSEICVGKDACLAIRTIVTCALLGIGGIITGIIVICACCIQPKGSKGRVFAQPNETIRNRDQQQNNEQNVSSIYKRQNDGPVGNFPPPPSYDQAVSSAAVYNY